MTARFGLLFCAVIAGAAGGCAPKPSLQPTPDATPSTDASEPPDGPCATWYRDKDADGHGDVKVPKIACTQPAGYVASSDDCDDDSAYRFPGNREVCDLLDNDCSAQTVETCPTGCDVRTGPSGRYLFCTGAGATGMPYTAAVSACDSMGYKLVKVDGPEENGWLTSNIAGASTYVWLGATDRAQQGSWRWISDDSPLTYDNWSIGQPNDVNGYDCAFTVPGTLIPDYAGQWFVGDCSTYRLLVVCERAQ